MSNIQLRNFFIDNVTQFSDVPYVWQKAFKQFFDIELISFYGQVTYFRKCPDYVDIKIIHTIGDMSSPEQFFVFDNTFIIDATEKNLERSDLIFDGFEYANEYMYKFNYTKELDRKNGQKTYKIHFIVPIRLVPQLQKFINKKKLTGEFNDKERIRYKEYLYMVFSHKTIMRGTQNNE